MCVFMDECRDAMIYDIAFDNWGQFVAIGSADNKVRIVKLSKYFRLEATGVVAGSQETTSATGCFVGTSARKATVLHEIQFDDGVSSVDLHPDGQLLATGSSDGMLCIVSSSGRWR